MRPTTPALSKISTLIEHVKQSFKGANPQKKDAKSFTEEDSFKQAASWADEVVGLREENLNRYRIGFYSSVVVNVLLAISLSFVASQETIQPMMVHHYANGIVNVEPVSNQAMPVKQSETEADIARFIRNYFSYSLASFEQQYKEVELSSNDEVFRAFDDMQSIKSPDSPINLLKDRVDREVKLYSLDFLDSASLQPEGKMEAKSHFHSNLAAVVFSIVDTVRATGAKQERVYRAKVSWDYQKPSDDPSERRFNFNGFIVTSLINEPYHLREGANQ